MNEAWRGEWDAMYSENGALYGSEPNIFVREFARTLRPCRVLDLGCGQGRNAVFLALQGHEVTGIDFSDVAIAQASELADRAGVSVDFRQIDVVNDWEPEPEFDVAVLSYFQLFDAQRPIAHAKVSRALKPGGRLFLIAHHRDNLEDGVGGPPRADLMFTEVQLADDFSELDIVRNEMVHRHVDGADRPALDILCEAVKPG